MSLNIEQKLELRLQARAYESLIQDQLSITTQERQQYFEIMLLLTGFHEDVIVNLLQELDQLRWSGFLSNEERDESDARIQKIEILLSGLSEDEQKFVENQRRQAKEVFFLKNEKRKKRKEALIRSELRGNSLLLIDNYHYAGYREKAKDTFGVKQLYQEDELQRWEEGIIIKVFTNGQVDLGLFHFQTSKGLETLEILLDAGYKVGLIKPNIVREKQYEEKLKALEKKGLFIASRNIASSFISLMETFANMNRYYKNRQKKNS